MIFLIRIGELFLIFLYYALAKILIHMYVESMADGVTFIIMYTLFIFISIVYIIHKLPPKIAKYI